MKDDVRTRIATLLGGSYAGFGPTLAAEKLGEREDIVVSRGTLQALQIEHGLWRPKRRRAKRVFALRQRRARFGELIQIDGSPHDWFEGRRAPLHPDRLHGRGHRPPDGPSALPKPRPRGAYLEELKAHVLAHGRPLALYSDRHGIFRVNAKDAASGDG